MRFRLIHLLILSSVLLAACADRDAIPTATDDIYRPPTQSPTDIPTILALPEGGSDPDADDPRPTPTPACTNGLWFLADLTIPDGTIVQPGELLDKRWEVQNNGTCNWNGDYRVRLIAGPGMGVPVQQALIPALSGTEVVIRMNLIAPEEPGNYRSAWQAYDPQENAFGDPFFIDLVVEAPEFEGTPVLEGTPLNELDAVLTPEVED